MGLMGLTGLMGRMGQIGSDGVWRRFFCNFFDMRRLYVVAMNAIEVRVPEGLRAWAEVEPQFRPFAAEAADGVALRVDIACGPVPAPEGELIYEPEPGDVGFVAASAWRLAGGELVLKFRHIAHERTRLWMRMSTALDSAEIVIAADGDGNDVHFLSHALMLAYMLATCASGTLLLHAAAVVSDGRAYLFQGKSGTGKSTHAGLWLRHIAGTELLNDDNPVVRIGSDGVATAYGSPWSGKTPCYRNASAPVGAFVRIVRAADNELRRLTPLRAYASLTASVYHLPFLGERLWAVRHRALERLVEAVPCCEMRCRPDHEAAIACHAGLGAGA